MALKCEIFGENSNTPERKRRSLRRLHCKNGNESFSAFLVRVHSCFSSGSPKGESGSGPPTFRKEGSRHLQRNVLNCTSGGVRQICREVVFEILEKQGENHDYVKVWYSKLLDF